MERFRYYAEVNRKGDNMKMLTLGTLVFSLIFFTVIGQENTRKIVLYWAGLMFGLLIVNFIIDLKAKKKMKAYDSAKSKEMK